jgi:hypothetical protein
VRTDLALKAVERLNKAEENLKLSRKISSEAQAHLTAQVSGLTAQLAEMAEGKKASLAIAGRAGADPCHGTAGLCPGCPSKTQEASADQLAGSPHSSRQREPREASLQTDLSLCRPSRSSCRLR